jgi:hypothetical protein
MTKYLCFALLFTFSTSFGQDTQNKAVFTEDIDNFWAAYDNLKSCKTHEDSVNVIQKQYLDKATHGLQEFLKLEELTAENYVVRIAKYPKFYNSVRANTLEAKKTEPFIDDIFNKFKAIYPSFKPIKAYFVMGVITRGGGGFGDIVLIGTEISACNDKVDLSEIKIEALKKVLGTEGAVVQKIKNMVAHECVHTQQKNELDSTAINCPLLYTCMLEGSCDFIGELLVGGQINKVAQDYGDAHEKELWQQFKAELCSEKTENWVYNFLKATDKPADLGYYFGYKIAKAYFEKAIDKKQAIIDILKLKNPLQFLEKSGYDKKF